MKNLLDRNTFAEINDRIEKLTSNTKAQWGKMDVGQMVHHCQGPLNIMLGNNYYGLKPNWFAKTFIKKSLYSDKLWRKNLPTVKVFKITEPKDFNTELSKLKGLLNEFGSQLENTKWNPHPVFGEMTNEQWGKMQYKHLDHHLRQFGV